MVQYGKSQGGSRLKRAVESRGHSHKPISQQQGNTIVEAGANVNVWKRQV